MPPALNSDGPVLSSTCPLPHCMLHWLISRRDLIAPQWITVCVWRHCSRVLCDSMMCCRAFTPSLLHIIAIGRLHPISCFSLDCGVLMGFVPHWVSSCSLLSLSTPEFRSPSHGGNLNRSASLSCTERAPECGSVGGSVTQIPGTPFQYIPDFCVRALTDLQFVKVTILVPVEDEV